MFSVHNKQAIEEGRDKLLGEHQVSPFPMTTSGFLAVDNLSTAPSTHLGSAYERGGRGHCGG